jgi:hypothetical protein
MAVSLEAMRMSRARDDAVREVTGSLLQLLSLADRTYHDPGAPRHGLRWIGLSEPKGCPWELPAEP